MASVLFVEAHCDDVLLCSGATYIKHRNQDDKIWHVIVSDCQGFCDPTEITKVTMKLHPYALLRMGLEVDRLPLVNNRDIVRHKLEDLRDHIGFDVVYMPSPLDLHQDHAAVAEEAMRAFRNSEGLYLQYETPTTWNTMMPNYVSLVSEEWFDRKMDLLSIFKSQEGKPYINVKLLKSLARLRGYPWGLGEGFRLWRHIA